MLRGRDLSYQDRKVAHWSRFGTPSEIDRETGAAAPSWVLEQREARRKALSKKARPETPRRFREAAE